MRARRTEDPASLRTWLLPLSLAGLGALGWACQDFPDDGGTDDGADLARDEVLRSIANNVLVPSTAELATRAATLDATVRAYADAVATDPAAVDEPLAAAQAAWHDTMAQQQVLEVMQLGPAAPSISALGGEDRRDAIYSWPTADSCSVDRALTEERYAADDFFTTELVWSHGLDALEYLLFVHDDAHTCPSQVQLDGPWAALGPEEIERRRGAYATRLATELAAQAQALATRWSPEGDDFGRALAEPGSEGSPYVHEVQALDDVFRAVFYLDWITKDDKLGLPLGIATGCPAAPCVDLMEAPWSGDAAASIAANLQGVQLVLEGGPDPDTAVGFYDLLTEVGHEELAAELRGDISAAIELAEGFDAPLQQVAATDPARVQALYDAIKDVTDDLKGPLVMALMLTVPAEGAGDND